MYEYFKNTPLIGLLFTVLFIHRSLSENDFAYSEDYSGIRLSERKCQEYSSQVYERVVINPDDDWSQQPSALTCVHMNDFESIQTVGAYNWKNIHKVGQFPHMAGVGWKKSRLDFEVICGGTLISPRFVLTAAHCVVTAPQSSFLAVRLGVVDIKQNPTPDETFQTLDVAVKEKHKHPEYTRKGRYNDIALLELEQEVSFSSNIRPACLWNSSDLGENKNAWATGWGVVNSSTIMTSRKLLKVSLDIIENNVCNFLLKDLIDSKWHGFSDKQLCAGKINEEKDTCKGDSGGPLQVRSIDSTCVYYVIGVTAKGRPYCGTGPAIYTRVSSYLDWIEKIVWPGES